MCPSGSELRTDVAGKKPNLRSAFEVLDVDSDGKISQDDLRTFYAGISGWGSEEMIGSMMSAADTNRDGFVEYEEFEKVLNSVERKPRASEVMEEVFLAMDGDGDGKVGHGDLKSYLSWAGLDAADDDVEAMIRFADGDNDGVTYEGFLKILAL